MTTDPTTLRTALEALIADGIEAFRLTREYVGDDVLPDEPGWSWFDWAQRARAALLAAATEADALRSRVAELEEALDRILRINSGPEALLGSSPACASARVESANIARAALATPAPAADEARCAFVGCGGVRDDVFHEPCLPGGAFHDHKACHPFQPAPTPAPPTPPATERKYCSTCAYPTGGPPRDCCCLTRDEHDPPATEGWYHGDLTDAQIDRMLDPRTPATEPVAALGLCQWTPTTEPCLGDPGDWRHRRCLPEGDPCPDPCPAMPGCHPYTPVAARAEVDVERLARALHDQGFGCNAYRCSLGRGSSADAHEQDARFLADAYRETADDR